MIVLSEIENDALAELANIGVSKASVALSRIVGDEVAMSVPTVEVVPCAEAARRFDAEYAGRLAAVSERFGGSIAGVALLVVPEANCLELVRAALPDEVPPDEADALAPEALAEVGNIALNNGLSSMANMLGARLDTALPRVLFGNGLEVFAQCGAEGGPEPTAIVFTTRIRMKARNIPAEIVIAVDAASEEALRARIAAYVERVLG
ncbi:MAG TPA: chemotaxis protein CheC [Azospirillum sp.]|nr:chemotaxis protein CheC [Azospirillum sp.]